MFDFSNKTVIVTGGSRGIGAEAVRLFARNGANVAFNYNKNYRLADNLAEECSGFAGDIYFNECNVRDYQEVQIFINKVVEQFGKIDVLVNNAGIWEYGAIEEMGVDDWRKTMQINLDSVFYFCHLVVKHMKEHKIKGSIVNISSTAGQRGEAYHSHYAATKGAIIRKRDMELFLEAKTKIPLIIKIMGIPVLGRLELELDGSNHPLLKL